MPTWGTVAEKYAGEAAWSEWFAICSVGGCSEVNRDRLRAQVESAMYAQLARFGLSRDDAGDVIGDYSFARRLKPGDEVVFGDMAIYTMVKNNTFNGMPLPSIALRKKSGRVVILREFGYNDFKCRLGGQ